MHYTIYLPVCVRDFNFRKFFSRIDTLTEFLTMFYLKDTTSELMLY